MELARCIRCDKTFTIEEVGGKDCCPGCGTKARPVDPKHDVTVKVNAHELHVLGVWAENYAVSQDNQHLDDPNWVVLKETVNAICDRLRVQLKEQGKDQPLTLSSEFKQIEKEYPGSRLFRGGHEEV